MTHIYGRVLSGVLLIVTSLATRAGAQPAGQGLPDELNVFASCVGRFSVASTLKPNKQFKDGINSKGETVGKWVHKGQFLRWEGSAKSESGSTDWSEMITYDRRIGKYKRFTFSSEGLAVETIGEWDAQTSTMRWSHTNLAPGWTFKSETRIDKDTTTHTVFIKNDKDEVIRDLVVVNTRLPD